MEKMTLEEKRRLSKILGENIVEEDDDTAMLKLTEVFKRCTTADLVYKVVENLADDEKQKLIEMVNSKEEVVNADAAEEVETTDSNEETTEEETDDLATETEENAEETSNDVAETKEETVDEAEETETSTEDSVDKETDFQEEVEESTDEKTEEETVDETTEETNAETDKVEDDSNDNKVDADNANTNNDELFDAKLEAALLRANVREDKIESAKKLFKVDHTIEDIEKVKNFVKEYPEWINKKSVDEPKSFTAEVGNEDSSLTAEEKRLKELGIV